MVRVVYFIARTFYALKLAKIGFRIYIRVYVRAYAGVNNQSERA